MAPAGTASFFAGMKVMEGRPREAVPALQAKLWPVLLANWSVWPIANLVNFAFVPPQQRILYINILSVAWVAYMSHMAAAHSGDPDEGGEDSKRPHPWHDARDRVLGSDPDGLVVFEAPASRGKRS
ncbi:hypothetical protein DUNSADRAFT_1025 [Dunaliella salina]|uniref:Uncharacterized protein n=1 Tax=Dunaliella salina TaxID=3046 RepID=A0ABQ7GXK8_DUNSA|nr:hypothetical protein DUNSADRAFT_1025 [Dunaliella salina]|eukprot:KAF5839341.1 hypothetical protein DUNSADRAFT_1025 [Dunaliella salina]